MVPAPALEKYIIERRSMVDLHLKIDIEIALELDTDYTFEYLHRLVQKVFL